MGFEAFVEVSIYTVSFLTCEFDEEFQQLLACADWQTLTGAWRCSFFLFMLSQNPDSKSKIDQNSINQ